MAALDSSDIVAESFRDVAITDPGSGNFGPPIAVSIEPDLLIRQSVFLRVVEAAPSFMVWAEAVDSPVPCYRVPDYK